jgi:hypothetical protein
MGMLPLFVRISLAVGLALSRAATAPARSGPDLHGYKAARLVPYVNAGKGPNAFTDPPKLSFLVQAPGGGVSREFTMTMDISTTGVVIFAADLPG